MSRNERCRLRGDPCRRPGTLSGRFGIHTGYSCIRTVTALSAVPAAPAALLPATSVSAAFVPATAVAVPSSVTPAVADESAGIPASAARQGARNFGGRTGFRNIGRIDAQGIRRRRNPPQSRSPRCRPTAPGQPAGRLDPHGLVSLRVQQPVERGCKRKILEFEHADALYGQHVALARAGNSSGRKHPVLRQRRSAAYVPVHRQAIPPAAAREKDTTRQGGRTVRLESRLAPRRSTKSDPTPGRNTRCRRQAGCRQGGSLHRPSGNCSSFLLFLESLPGLSAPGETSGPDTPGKSCKYPAR